jgi:hypothetical protein
MLGYVEKGTRFPSEALVRRLAAVRKQDPHELLALLWRDRMVYALGRELKRVLRAPRAVTGIEDAEMAVLVSEAIAALPDDGSWIGAKEWRAEFRPEPRRGARKAKASGEPTAGVEDLLRQRGLIEIRSGKVRRRGRHYVAEGVAERQALALEFCALFTKALLDKLALAEVATGTYLRNHYLNIEEGRVAEFEQRLEEALRKLAEEFAADPSATTRFMNVLVGATPF